MGRLSRGNRIRHEHIPLTGNKQVCSCQTQASSSQLSDGTLRFVCEAVSHIDTLGRLDVVHMEFKQ